MNLYDLLGAIGVSIETVSQVNVTGLALDSREVSEGTVFFAMEGTNCHGMEYAQEAVERGAAAIVCDSWDGVIPFVVPVIIIENLRQRLGTIVQYFFDSPCQNMQIIGVTGTNGKTTTIHLIDQLAKSLGIATGKIGTLGVSVGVDKLYQFDRTTPDVITLTHCLAQLCARKVSLCAMEVSSHALDQHRVSGIPFDVAVLTNLTRDHLDYHVDMLTYGNVKRRLFTDYGAKIAVICSDDPFGARLAAELCGFDLWTFGFDRTARIRITTIEPIKIGCHVELVFDGHQVAFQLPLLGQFNVHNTISAMAAVYAVAPGNLERLISAAHHLEPAAGRMEYFQNPQMPTVVVDYAHTPDALEQALNTCRWHSKGLVWAVFGCGGDRDKGKRPLMGEIASRLADEVVLTLDNPRSESPDAIINNIVDGMERAPRLIKLDRAEAVRYVIAKAAPEDWILIAGKGHESTQLLEMRTIAHSDRAIVASAYGLSEKGELHAS
ncbi:UDP-N-acetylmuramoyl-L-alanyl-D-glutamate--2,6-diaminopimelate ligase [Litorivicinus sp.]|nr:UDP-N-acetylmuramoyl-L-alanyl-D-glutamate--2,6-diaminopimelate ligase [Litorivicinus sp.]